MRKTLEERFWPRVDIQGPDECWLWIAGATTRGYGRFYVRGKGENAHRVSWMLTNGEIPEGMCVCHVCDVPSCVNPSHLFLGTHAQNVADMVRKGRIAVGSAQGLSRLTEPQVREIRRRYAAGGETKTALAAEFGVDRSTVWAIVQRKTWKHVEVAL